VLQELSADGVRIALDDFGTGYSSLRHLQALPIDRLKVDASFVIAMANDGGSRAIVSAVLGLGNSLGLLTVAEGVRTSRRSTCCAGWAADRAAGCSAGRCPNGSSTRRCCASAAPPSTGPCSRSLAEAG
jgi:predicted signal transduction protein with EAL and GGDEF domain